MITLITGQSGAGKTSYIKKELAKYSKKDVAYLPQEVLGIFNPLNTIESQIFELDLCRDKLPLEKLNFLLHKLNLNTLNLKRYPYEFSNGELQRLAILVVLLKRDVKKIFLDEPTSSLDATNQQALVEVLNLEKVPIVITTHNLNFAFLLSKNIKIIANGELKDFSEKYAKNDDFNVILAKKYKKIENNSNNVNNFSFLNNSQTLLIFGNSGYGKTSILQKMYSFLTKNNQKAVLLSQNYGFSLPPHKKILQTLFEVINFREKKFFSSKQDVREIIKTLKTLHLSRRLLKKYPQECSQGEQQRLVIIRAILLRSEVILLDEPTSSLDLGSEKSMLSFLLEAQKKHQTKIVIVSHSNYVISNLLSNSVDVLFFSEPFKHNLFKVIN